MNETDKNLKRNLWMFPLGTVGRDMLYQLFNNFLLVYVLFTRQLTAAQLMAITAIMVAARIFDALNDPIMGNIIERTRTHWGKYKPWQAIGIVLTSLVVYLAFNVRLQGWPFVIFFGVIYFCYSIVYTMHDISYWGMVAALGSAVVVYYNTSDAVSVIDAIFESCSAFGTVGLSVGVTAQLNQGAKLLYMLVMFMGRVGPVSLAISLTAKPDDNKRKIMPVGHINVG